MLESEKVIEKRLRIETEKVGGVCYKLSAQHNMGIPDRMCLLPGGHIFFAELKSTGKKPTKIQDYMHRLFRKLGWSMS